MSAQNDNTIARKPEQVHVKADQPLLPDHASQPYIPTTERKRPQTPEDRYQA